MKPKLRYHKAKTTGRHIAMPEGLPGLRGRANWHVKQSLPGETPSTINYRGGEAHMSVPDEDGTMDKLTIIHEMLHAAHSPIEPPKELPRGDGTMIKTKAVLIAEELRINMMMRFGMGSEWTQINMDPAGIQEVIRFHLKHPSPDMLEFILIQHLCSWPLYRNHTDFLESPVYDVLFAIQKDPTTPPELVSFLENVCRWIYSVNRQVAGLGFFWDNMKKYHEGTIPSWVDCTIPVAEYLDRVFDGVEEAFNTASELAKTQNAPGEYDGDLQKIMNRFERPHTRQMNDLAAEPTGERKPVKFAPTGGKPEWGNMEINEPKRAERLPGKHLQKSKYRSTDMGVVPRNIHRSIIDGNVFAVKRQILGGAVLIDDSGSMSWKPEQIEDVMKAAPAVVIAAYSGARARGELRILAKDKRRVAKGDIKTPYGGNDVDFPALEWLAKQSKPRIWVTDGGVHPGISGDAITAAKQCVDFCVDNDINVVEDAVQAHDVFMGKRALYR